MGDQLAGVGGDRLLGGFVLEGIELAARVAVAAVGARGGQAAGLRVDRRHVAEQVTGAAPVPEPVAGHQPAGQARLGPEGRLGGGTAAPGAVDFGDLKGFGVGGVPGIFGNVAALAGDPVEVPVDGGGDMGALVAAVAVHRLVEVGGAQVGAAAGDAVTGGGVAGAAAQVGAAAGHVDVEGAVGGEPVSQGQVAALDAVAPAGQGVAGQAVLAGGGQSGFAVAGQTVDVFELGAAGHRLGAQAAADVALGALLPVAENADRVAVQGSGPFALGGSAVGHVGGRALPLVVDRSVYLGGFGGVASQAVGVAVMAVGC